MRKLKFLSIKSNAIHAKAMNFRELNFVVVLEAIFIGLLMGFRLGFLEFQQIL